MKTQFTKFILIITITVITKNFAMAGWLDDLSSKIEATAPSAYQTQGGIYFSGGGYSYKAPSSTISLVNATAPSIKAGCGGINIEWGGLKFVDGQALIEFAKKVIGAAPGYAFNLAMQTLCPQCTDLMNTLSEAANMLNGMDLDSCAVAKAAVDAGGDLLGSALQNTSFADEKNSFNSAVKSMNNGIKEAKKVMEGVMNKVCASTAIGKTDCPKPFLLGEATLLQTVFSRNEILGDMTGRHSTIPTDHKTGLINLVRALVGDVRVVIKDQPEESVSVLYINPWFGAYNSPMQNELIDKWITGLDNVKAEMLITNASDVNSPVVVDNLTILDENGYRKISDEFKSFNGASKKNLQQISTAFKTRTALSNENLRFLSSFRSPVYKVLNNASIDNDMLDNFIGAFEALAGIQLAYETVSVITKELSISIALLEKELSQYKLVNTVDEYAGGLDDMKNNLRKLSEYTYNLYEKAYTQFDDKMRKINQLETMTKKMQALMARHPVAGSSVFAKGISK